MSKTHYMVFHRARRKIDHKDIILNNYILQVHFTKKLGVIIDDKLKWANHISYIKNKIAKGMGILLNARKVLKIKVLLQLYHSFVYPYLIYCSEVWGNASDIHPHPLIILQKKNIRIISFSRYKSPTKLLFQQYNILPFKKLVFQRLGLQLYKYEFGIIPIPLRSLFTKNSSVHNYNTRNSNKLRPAIARHAYRDKDFRFISVHVWNYMYICDNVNINVSFPSFKKYLKCFILSEKFSFEL